MFYSLQPRTGPPFYRRGAQKAVRHGKPKTAEGGGLDAIPLSEPKLALFLGPPFHGEVQHLM